MIELENVSLEYTVSAPASNHSYTTPTSEAGGKVISKTRRKHTIRALEDISFKLNHGDRLALIGHNGAGKSTLLRTIAGLLHPTRGVVKRKGKVVPLLNINFGLDSEVTGLENIWIRGLYLGMSRREIKQKLDVICNFTQLGPYLNLPIRTYSAGMKARLAFAISTHVDADILLLDEVIATGDAAFISHAKSKIESFAQQSNILVLASHSNSVLKRLCNKGLVLEKGKVLAYGNLDEALRTYKHLNQKKTALNPEKNTSQLLHKKATINSKNKKKFRGRQEIHKVNATKPSKQNPPMKILLVNDTKKLTNPGSRAVIKGYKTLLNTLGVQNEPSHSIPVNYWKEPFRAISIPGRKLVIEESDELPRSQSIAPPIDIQQWERIRQCLFDIDTDFKNKVSESDLVIINAEGSIHHNSMRALSVLALTKSAIQLGKKTIVLNATIEAMMEDLIVDALKGASLIHARESHTQNYLKNLGIESVLAGDIAFTGMVQETNGFHYDLDENSKNVLISTGVLSSEEGLEAIINACEHLDLKLHYLLIGDGNEKNIAEKICTPKEIPIINSADIGVKAMVGFLKSFTFAISGRHHLNIYLMRAGIPFIPLPSNTWKVQASLEMINYPLGMVENIAQIPKAMKKIIENLGDFKQYSETAFNVGYASNRHLINELTKCIY